MKKGFWMAMVALALVTMVGCKTEEQIRVESVIGEYDCYESCSVTNLLTQDPPATSMDTSILYVTKPKNDDDGFVALMGQEVFLEKDLTFRKSITDYSLIGEFDGNGNLTFAIDFIDSEAQTRSQCSYVCKLR